MIQVDLRSAGATWTEIESIYHQRTDDIIRSSVTTIYELAARRTAEHGIRVPYFLTQQDLIEIRRLSHRYQDLFWLALNREINTHDTLGVKQHYHPKTLMLIREEDTRLRNGFIGRIAQSVHGEAAAVGAVSKARQVVLQHNVRTSIKLLQAATKQQTQQEQLLSKAHFTWKKADSTSTCPVCGSLEGTRYFLDDPNTPIPSHDTHPRCTCELVLEDATLEGVQAVEAADLFF